MNIKQTLRSIALGTVLLAAGVSTSHAVVAVTTATGNSNVSVSVPSVIILDYFDNINISLPEVQESHGHGAYTAQLVSWADQTVNGPEGLTTSNVTTPSTNGLDGTNTIDLVLKNTWAVRGLSTSGTATVSISQPTAFNLKNANNDVLSSIAVSNIKIQTTGKTASSSINDVPLKGIPKANATLGDVLMSLNLKDTVLAGNYTGTLTITAVAN
ncbi:MAG: hypothetical protein FDX30_09935 [Chlorobium sp.]|nr:MAG: hypothetical protein FDX30_09935 [Chlorobium sp.]